MSALSANRAFVQRRFTFQSVRGVRKYATYLSTTTTIGRTEKYLRKKKNTNLKHKITTKSANVSTRQ